MKAISIIRFFVFMVLLSTAMIFLFGEEQDENIGAFFLHFIFDKAIAAVLFTVCYMLFNHWSEKDALFRYGKKMMEEE